MAYSYDAMCHYILTTTNKNMFWESLKSVSVEMTQVSAVY